MPFWQRLIWPVGGVYFISIWIRQATTERYLEKAAWAMMAGVVFVLLSRALLYMDSVAFEDPNRSIFFGIYAFIPVVYISAFITFEPKSAVIACVSTWLLFVFTTSFWLVPAAIEGRQGADYALIVLYIGQPISILLLSALPGYHRLLEQNEAKHQETAERAEQYLHDAITDHLTKLLNRRGFDDLLDNLWNNPATNTPWSLLVYADVDYFKRYNDALGHLAGDKCLQELGDLIKAFADEKSLHASRMGGEEFTLFGLFSTAEEAYAAAIELEWQISKAAIPHPATPSGKPLLTMSFGCAICETAKISKREFINSADQALYRAKNEGRNRLCFSQDALTAVSKSYASTEQVTAGSEP